VLPTSDPTTDEETPVSFEVTASDPDGDSLTYKWLLDDVEEAGETTDSYELVPDYDMSGVHKVKVVVNDSALETEYEWGVVVDNVNRPPVADATVNKTRPGIGLSVQFDASASTDPDGQSLSYIWDFGDGSTPVGGNPLDHIYKKPGIYTATVTASDGTDQDQATVEVDVNITEDWMSQSFGTISQMVVYDIDNDGTKEIIFGAVEDLSGNDVTGFLYIYDGKNHNQEWKSGDIGKVLDIKIGNVDGDPADEIVIGTIEALNPVATGGDYSGRVLALDGVNPATTDFDSGDIGQVRAVGIRDLDNDDTLEIVAVHTDTFRSSLSTETYYGNITIWGDSGAAIVQEWTSTNFGGSGSVIVTDDIDGDNMNETIIGTMDSLDIMAGDYTGRVVTLGYTGATYTIENTNPNVGNVISMAVADPDKDSNTEVLVGAQANSIPTDHLEGYLYVLTETLTQEVKSADLGVVNCIEVIDVDNDNVNEIILGVYYNQTEDPNNANVFYPEGEMYILNGATHNEKYKASDDIDIGGVISLDVGNIDESGTLEIAVGTEEKIDASGNFEGSVYVFFYNLSVTSFEFLWESPTLDRVNALVIDDLDDDGFFDLVFGTEEKNAPPYTGKIYVYTNANKD
jgi:PKD repeat protein